MHTCAAAESGEIFVMNIPRRLSVVVPSVRVIPNPECPFRTVTDRATVLGAMEAGSGFGGSEFCKKTINTYYSSPPTKHRLPSEKHEI